MSSYNVNGAPLGGGGASLPTAAGAGETLVSTGAGTTYVATPLVVASHTLGHSWEQPSPDTVPMGSTFVNSDDLTEQVSSGLAASAGVAASGWMRRLPTGLGPGRAALAGTPPRVSVTSLNLSAYTIGNATMAALWTWDGTQPSAFGIGEIVTIGDSNDELRGFHITYKTNGGNTDLVAWSQNSTTVLVPSVNLIAGAVGLHAIAIAPVNASGHKWRFSYDGSAVVDVTMAATYLTPLNGESIGFGGRPDGMVYLNGRTIDLAVWGSLLSNADILALATLPGTPTYELPESASTGVAGIRVQACRYDPLLSLTSMPARGISKPLTVGSGVTKVTL